MNKSNTSGLTLGSLFDGSGGFPLGGLISGITPLWASEIEPFPIRVTTKRLPNMKHYGDISTLKGGELEPVDIITFGSPCQDMSVAGRREGLDGSRSSLFYEAIRIVKEMRYATDGEKPRYIVWENVPGAFSSNQGADFQTVLKEICSVKGYKIHTARPQKWPNAGQIVADDFSLAWRVFDAQYWGVPQRRQRIYLVADFADQCAGKILFESEGVSGYSPQSFRAWQEIASDHGRCPKETGIMCLSQTSKASVTMDVTNTLRASGKPPLVFENHGQDSRYSGPHDVSQTVLSTFGAGGNNQPIVIHQENQPANYIVRRLTPTECARLQGFPDWWCADLGTDDPTEDDIAFWAEVFETHRKAVGTYTTPKTRNQIVKWLKAPQSDTAEYKMWGNGVALPNVCFVLAGIAYYSRSSACLS